MSRRKEPNPSFNHFTTLFNNSVQNCILLMNKEGIVTTVNQAFTNWFGYEEKDIVGKSAAILFTEEDLAKGMFEKELQNLMSKGQSTDKNYLVNKDQTLTWVSGESVMAKNSDGDSCILKVIQDINTLKISESNLRSLNDFNENILASIEDVVIVVNNKMDILKTNNAYTKFFGKDRAAAPPFNFGDLIKQYDGGNNLIKDLQESIITKQGFIKKHVEISIIPGEKVYFEVTGTPLNNSNDTGVLLIMHDISVYKQVEREREDIIGFVTHELRNPLSALIVSNELMTQSLEQKDLGAIKEMLIRGDKNLARLKKMVNELYESTKVESGFLQLEITEFNFENMIFEAIGTVNALHATHRINVTGKGNILVRADRNRLIQVVNNYLTNGIKYSNGNPDITLIIEHDSNSITVAVKDEGMGISKTLLPFIFQRFFRAEKTRNIEGIGLGLYLCERIINAHHGRVWAECEEGMGSTFFFSIPLQSSD